MARVLVLNATYEPINVCTLRRAAVLLLKEKAELLEQQVGALHSERMTMEKPDVIRLVNYVRIPREAHRRKITRRAVLARDSWTCQYCGTKKSGLTVDHVIPRSRGGKSVWENIVAACASCNRRKGNRLPREIQMHPKTDSQGPGPNHLHPSGKPPHPPGLAAVPTGSSLRPKGPHKLWTDPGQSRPDEALWRRSCCRRQSVSGRGRRCLPRGRILRAVQLISWTASPRGRHLLPRPPTHFAVLQSAHHPTPQPTQRH